MAEQKEVQKLKRRRINPTIRWGDSITLKLIRKVIECVKDSPESFEKPTAQRFYETLANGCSQLQKIPWGCMKNKMWNCKTSYFEANKWKEKIGNDLIADGDDKSVVDYFQRNCPYYDELHEIFGQRRCIKFEQFICNDYDESAITTSLASFSSEEVSDTDHSLSKDANDTLEVSPESKPILASIGNNTQGYNKRQQKSAETSNNSVLTFRMTLEQEKLQLKRDKFEWKKKKEQQELDNYFQIMQKELKLKERVKVLELELKYRKNEENN